MRWILALLLFFLPAHLAIVLLSDLNFIPSPPGASHISHHRHRKGDKDRTRIQIFRASDTRPVAEARASAQVRDLSLSDLLPPAGVPPPGTISLGVRVTRPSSLRFWLAATPQSLRAPPV